jgi:hypothetical protein
MGGGNGLQRLILFFAAPRTPVVLQSQNGEADRPDHSAIYAVSSRQSNQVMAENQTALPGLN